MGADVHALVYYNSFNLWGWLDYLPHDVKSQLNVFSGDICEPYFVRSAIKKCDVVFHFLNYADVLI
jgi:hypothetical protein